MSFIHNPDPSWAFHLGRIKTQFYLKNEVLSSPSHKREFCSVSGKCHLSFVMHKAMCAVNFTLKKKPELRVCGHTTLPYTIVSLHFSDIVGACFCSFYKLEVCGSSLLIKSLGTIFPKTFAHFVSPGQILAILTVFQIIHRQKRS